MTWFKEKDNNGVELACKWLYDNYGNSILVKFNMQDLKMQLGLDDKTYSVFPTKCICEQQGTAACPVHALGVTQI